MHTYLTWSSVLSISSVCVRVTWIRWLSSMLFHLWHDSSHEVSFCSSSLRGGTEANVFDRRHFDRNDLSLPSTMTAYYVMCLGARRYDYLTFLCFRVPSKECSYVEHNSLTLSTVPTLLHWLTAVTILHLNSSHQNIKVASTCNKPKIARNSHYQQPPS